MHFTVLYIMEDVKLEDLIKEYGGKKGVVNKIYDDFGTLYCDGCGEFEPENCYVCDWFQIGGRWFDILPAKNGISGDASFILKDTKETQNFCSICNIEDLDKNFEFENKIYGIADNCDYFENEDYMKQIFDKIRKNEIKGVIALLDCHS